MRKISDCRLDELISYGSPQYRRSHSNGEPQTQMSKDLMLALRELKRRRSLDKKI
jgi:hypothetical protein